MINRIVRLSFHTKHVEEFIQIFNESKLAISAFDGCLSLMLMQDAQQNNVFYTYSIWNSLADLECYRNSDLFKHTWVKTKALFNDKPLAFSTVISEQVK